MTRRCFVSYVSTVCYIVGCFPVVRSSSTNSFSFLPPIVPLSSPVLLHHHQCCLTPHYNEIHSPFDTPTDLPISLMLVTPQAALCVCLPPGSQSFLPNHSMPPVTPLSRCNSTSTLSEIALKVCSHRLTLSHSFQGFRWFLLMSLPDPARASRCITRQVIRKKSTPPEPKACNWVIH